MGSGIGLSITKELIELMNGQITVKSQIDVGTTFLVTLPITNEAFVPPNPKLLHRAVSTLLLSGRRLANSPIKLETSSSACLDYSYSIAQPLGLYIN